VSDQVAGIFCLALGFSSAAYLIYGWRRGEIRARGISKRSDEPLSWWSAILVIAVFSGCCLYAGFFILAR
jgi:hypothetical protein